MEVEIQSAEEFSKEELRKQLYSSLRSAGVLDSMKGQLRARLLEHLRHQNGDAIKRQKKPSLTERLLSSLFLDYLECSGFTFTISVFIPESQMASWPPFSYEEMLELLHLDPTSDLHIRQKLLSGEGRQCLAHQLVTVLQQMTQRNCIQEVSTQTSPSEACQQQAARTSEMYSIKEVDEDAYFRRKEAHDSAHRLLPYRSLEDKITVLRQEFDARVNAEVALQVSRVREYEINAARMDEAARFRRQLARDREELEDIHKARLDCIKAREESLLERMQSKEKAIEASAFEQRQKILAEITAIREREKKLRQFKESQEHREEKLDERELSLRAKEDEVARVRKALYTQADDIMALRRKELEEQYEELFDRLHHDRTLDIEDERGKSSRATIQLAASSRSDKELIEALQRRRSLEEDQRSSLVQTIRELEEKLKQQSLPAPAPVVLPHQRLEERILDLQAELEKERLQRQASEKENKTSQQKKVELTAARSPHGEWITEHKNLMATILEQEAELPKKGTKLQLMEKLSTRHRMLLLKIDHLGTLVKKAHEEKDLAMCNLEILQVQHTTDKRELLETIMLLKKSQQALEAEQLQHSALRSALVPSISVAPQRDHLSRDQHGPINNPFDHKFSGNEVFRKKLGSSRTEPQRESHDWWTQILSDSAAKRASLDHDLERNPVNHFPTSTTISTPFSSSFGYQLMDGGTTAKGGTTSATKTESLIQTVVNGSIDEYYINSWDQGRYADLRCEDAVPSWRKICLPEDARPNSWNKNGFEESLTEIQSVVTNCDWSKVDVGVCSSRRDPGSAWNLGQYSDLSRWDMACLEREEKMGVKYDYQESSNGFQNLKMIAQIRSASIPGINNPAANVRDLKRPDTAVEQRALLRSGEGEKSLAARHMQSSSATKGATATKSLVQRDTHTMGYKCQGGLSSSDVCNDHEREDLDLNPGKPFLKDDYYATSNDEEGQSQTSAYGFTTSTNIQTSMDLSSVEFDNVKKDSRSSWDQEKHKTNSRTSLELTQDIDNNDGDGDLLTVRDIPVASHTEEEQGAESPWNLYLRVPEENTRDHSEADENLSQDLPSCKCILSLKYGLESLEESIQSRDEMDSHSKGDHHNTVDSTTENPKNPTTMPEIDNMEPLSSARSVHSRSCEYVRCKEKIEDNQHYSRSEIESTTDEEGKTMHATQEMDATDESHEPLKLANRFEEVTKDVTSLAPNMKQSEETTPSTHNQTLSIGDSVIACDPEKYLNQLMRSLGLTVATIDEPTKCLYKKEEEPLSEEDFRLSRENSQRESTRSLVHENHVLASGKMSGLPEIYEMLFKQEMHSKEKAQKNLDDSTAETQVPPERAEIKGNTDVNLDSSQASKLPDYDTHSLETLQTSIVIRKQEVTIDKEIDKETGDDSPRLIMDSMVSHKNHPVLALATTNNQFVKLEAQDEISKEGKPAQSFLSQVHAETTIINKLSNDETRFSKEIPRLVNKSLNIQHASGPTHTPASHKKTHSSSDESIYEGDSFEEDEEEDKVDQKPTYSEESRAKGGMRASREQAPGSLGPEKNERSSPSSQLNVEGNESRSLGRSSENRDGESEQGSYSPDDNTVADSTEWLNTRE